MSKLTVTSFRQGYLSGTSRRSGNLEALTIGDYDAVILTSSWDARSITLTAATKTKCDLGIALLFTCRDHQGLRDQHDPKIKSFLESISSRCSYVLGDSCDVNDIWGQLSSQLINLRKERQRPLRVLMDLSACPRYFALGVAALSFTHRVAKQVVVFYAEGVYNVGGGVSDIAFTGGHWSTVAVPFLSGYFEPSKPRQYVVSVGFEGEKTLRAISRADPDRVSLLFPKPGVSPEYEKRAALANEPLVREFLIPESHVVNAPASDTVAVWKTLAKSAIIRSGRFNDYYLCCGPKPHALALGLHALAVGRPAVLYNIPDEHRVHQTRSNGVFWTYEINDLSSVD